MQKIQTYLDSEFSRRSRKWDSLRNLLVDAVPPDLLDHIVYAVVEDTELLIFCDAPSWTSKLRFYDADISKILKSRGLVIRRVKTRTVPAVELRGSQHSE